MRNLKLAVWDFTLENDIYIENNSITLYNTNNENTVIYFTKELASHAVYHMLTPIEYPATSPEGVAYVFNIEGWKEPLLAFKDIQYSIGKPEGKYKVMCPYLGVEVKREMQTCQEISSNNIDNNTFEFYLAVQETSCKFKINERLCEGKPVLHCLAHHNSLETKYFIGCTKWKYGEKHHRFIFVSSNVNLELLNNLYNVYAHQSGNVICHGPIVKKSCKVEFYKLTLLNLKKCPFVILICKGIYTHSPPPSIRTPINIKQRLQTLVQQANKDLTDITPTKIITGNLIKSYFGIDTLSEVYTSLNDIDKLQNCVYKIQKEKHPFEQDLLETSPSFKHIHDEGWGCIIGDLDIAQAIGLGETLASINNTYNWEEHLIYIFKSCQFKDDIRADIEALLIATPEKVKLIFNKLLTYNNNKLTDNWQSKGAKRKIQSNTLQVNNKKLKQPLKIEKIDLTNDEVIINKENTKETQMSLIEKLEYEERLLQLKEKKKKLRELHISNLIKEREHGLEH
ncbi:14342_t:CDS:10 [Cetraspora pellucida]|uniref:14342_t:CDS:1 n=1 Tax=Cetraspora pellucida TaxID=1433469 RepID=A0A9N8ZYX2_9GLOM|nr:14342_t:CDS:10 [Cetraspora pellucida]